MSRSIQDIYNLIIAEKQANEILEDLSPDNDNYTNLLSDLKNGSKVAVWRLWAYITAIILFTQENLWVKYRDELRVLAQRTNVGTREWYREQVLNFQFGYSLIYNTDFLRYEYGVIDEAAKIIKHVAVEVIGGSLLIKTAKELDGERTPLGTAELVALNAFVNQIYLPGDNVTVISFNADVMRIELNVFYNPLVLDSDGSLLLDPSSYPVQIAIENYLKTLDFNGAFNAVKLVDEIQKVEGVAYPVITDIQAKYGSASYAPVNTVYNSIAGYIKHDDTAGNSLVDTINYIPNV